MKRTKLCLLFALSGAMILASCGAQTPTVKKYNLTFHQTEPGVNEDLVVVVIKGKTTNPDVWEQEPEINQKTGYTAVWDEYDVEEMTADLTVVPVYTAIQYTATFINSVTGETIGTDKFTVEDTELNYPDLPEEKGYTYAWESVSISAQDLTVRCTRTANLHTIKFYADEEKTQQVGETLQFTIETTSLNEPEVPAKQGYDGKWGDYDLTCDEDIEVVAHYELHNYYIQFQVNGENYGDPVGYHYQDTWASIEKPSVDEIPGYTISWPESVDLLYKDLDDPQIVAANYVGNEYTVSYEGSSTKTTVTFGSPYTLDIPSPEFCFWYFNNVKVENSGNKWNIASDVTLSAKLDSAYRVIDFEDGENELITVHDGTVALSVVDDEGVNGSKALKAVFSSAGHLDIKKTFLDAILANPNVKALSFYAKSTTATNNFRHITVDQSVVHGNTVAFSTYESNISNYGVYENYKQFYLTRGIYEQMSASDWFIQYGATGTLYLDNITVSYHDYFDAQTWGFDNGWSRNVDANTYNLYNPVGSNVAQLLITGSSSFTDAGVDYSVFSEGVRSVTLTKASGQINYYLRSDFVVDNLPDEGLYFDFRTDTKWNESWHETSGSVGAGSIGTGKDNKAILYPFTVGAPSARTGVQNIPGQWQTLHIKKSEITSDGRFFIASGGAVGKVYIDNLRLATLPLDSFENAYAYNAGKIDNVVAGAACYPVSETVGTVPVPMDKKDYIFTTEWGNTSYASIPTAEITDERASHGDYSLKLHILGNNPLRVRPSYLQMLLREGGTLSFDVYSDDLADNKLSFTTLGGNVKSITKGQWSTITLTAADFLKSGQTTYHTDGRFTEGAFGNGTIYVDNIRFLSN